MLSMNPSAMHLIYKHRLNIQMLCCNPAAMYIISDVFKKQPHKINWNNLSLNTSPEAIEMLILNPEKINWDMLSMNPSAIHILELNQDKINWINLFVNPAIFIETNEYVLK